MPTTKLFDEESPPPTPLPTEQLTISPTQEPTNKPTTVSPTSAPTEKPSTIMPTSRPTNQPSALPRTAQPTTAPTPVSTTGPTFQQSTISSTEVPVLTPSPTVSRLNGASAGPSVKLIDTDIPTDIGAAEIPTTPKPTQKPHVGNIFGKLTQVPSSVVAEEALTPAPVETPEGNIFGKSTPAPSSVANEEISPAPSPDESTRTKVPSLEESKTLAPSLASEDSTTKPTPKESDGSGVDDVDTLTGESVLIEPDGTVKAAEPTQEKDKGEEDSILRQWEDLAIKVRTCLD